MRRWWILCVVAGLTGCASLQDTTVFYTPATGEFFPPLAKDAPVPVLTEPPSWPHKVIGRFGAAKIVMVPASPGTGVIAGASARAVLELAGVTDVLTKSYGSNCPKNLVRATFEGLRSLLKREEVEALRGVSVSA